MARVPPCGREVRIEGVQISFDLVNPLASFLTARLPCGFSEPPDAPMVGKPRRNVGRTRPAARARGWVGLAGTTLRTQGNSSRPSALVVHALRTGGG
jgi:hypothetical protein